MFGYSNRIGIELLNNELKIHLIGIIVGAIISYKSLFPFKRTSHCVYILSISQTLIYLLFRVKKKKRAREKHAAVLDFMAFILHLRQSNKHGPCFDEYWFRQAEYLFGPSSRVWINGFHYLIVIIYLNVKVIVFKPKTNSRTWRGRPKIGLPTRLSIN